MTMSQLGRHTLHIFCAQELNNSAAMYFEKGLYEDATASLHNGLKLLIAINHQRCDANANANVDHDSNTDSGECGNHSFGSHSCTIDKCIAFSEQTSFLIHGENDSNDSKALSPQQEDLSGDSHIDVHKNNTTDRNCNASKKRKLLHSRDVGSGLPTKTITSSSSSSNTRSGRSNGYVYQRPIRVPLEGFSHCQKGYMGLLVVIVFNLAIAHQRNVMEEESSDESRTENIAFLYNLCLDLLQQAAALPSSQSLSQSTTSSTRCKMLIHNNLSQLYKTGGNNPSKHQESLQDLLSTLMVLIERGTRESTSSSSNSAGSGGWDIGTRWTNMQRRNGEALDLVEGILDNLDPLILNEQCADAA